MSCDGSSSRFTRLIERYITYFDTGAREARDHGESDFAETPNFLAQLFPPFAFPRRVGGTPPPNLPNSRLLSPVGFGVPFFLLTNDKRWPNVGFQPRWLGLPTQFLATRLRYPCL